MSDNKKGNKKVAVIETSKVHQPTEEELKKQGYCVKCKSKKDMKEQSKVELKNGAAAIKGKCVTCNTNVFNILGKKGKGVGKGKGTTEEKKKTKKVKKTKETTTKKKTK